MRTVTSTFTAEKNKPSNQPIKLYTLENYDGLGTNLRFAAYDTDITYGGLLYTRNAIKYDIITENNQGAIDTVRVSVANVSRMIQSYLEQYDLRGRKVTIKTVWANQLADATAFIEDTFYIDSYVANEQAAVFILTSKFDVLSIELPLRRFSRNHCGWRFKGTECGYVGPETSCNKTTQRCKELANYKRFGGFPSIQANRMALG